MEETKIMDAPKNRLLYDEAYLDDVRERLTEKGIPPKATEIKHAVKTSAAVYEIRTALTFWFGGRMSHRESDRILSDCQAFKKGEWALNQDDEIIYND